MSVCRRGGVFNERGTCKRIGGLRGSVYACRWGRIGINPTSHTLSPCGLCDDLSHTNTRTTHRQKHLIFCSSLSHVPPSTFLPYSFPQRWGTGAAASWVLSSSETVLYSLPTHTHTNTDRNSCHSMSVSSYDLRSRIPQKSHMLRHVRIHGRQQLRCRILLLLLLLNLLGYLKVNEMSVLEYYCLYLIIRIYVISWLRFIFL